MKLRQSLNSFIERHTVLTACLVGALVTLIIMIVAAGQSVWFDEGYSVLLAKGSYGDLFGLTAVDTHPPLYYILLKLWADLFGFELWILRLLSALCMGSAVTVALLLTKRLFGRQAFIAAVPALLLAPFLLRYGYELRMYALATLIGVVATYVLVRAQVAKKSNDVWWWVAYAVLVALGMYTLYMMVALWFAHVAWLIWVSIKSKQRIITWRWLYALTGAVVLFLPYLTTFIHQLTKSALPGMGHEISLTILADVASVLMVFTPEWQLGGWATLLIVAASIGLTLLGVRVFQKTRGATKHYLVLYTCLAFVPLVFYAVSSLPPREPVFVVRYMAHVSIWLYLFAAVVVALAWRYKLRNVVLVALLCLGTLSIGVWNVAVRGNYIFERVQTPMTQEIRDNVMCGDDTIVVADDPYTYIDAAFYFDDCNLHFYAKDPVEKKGGYAPLHDSSVRVATPGDVTAQHLIHLHWGGETSFIPDQRYRSIERLSYDKQHVDTYELSEE